MNSPLNYGAGVAERDIDPYSGLLNRSVRYVVTSAQTQVVNAQTIGAASAADVLVWTNVTLNQKDNPYLVTLCAHVAQGGTPNLGYIRLRITGFDPYGQQIVETTPWATVDDVANTYIYLAYFFKYVSKVEYMSDNLDSAEATLSIGPRLDWTRTSDASNYHNAGYNLGLFLPLGTGLVLNTPTGKAMKTATGFAKPSTLTGTFTDLPNDSETITIAGVQYIMKTTLTGGVPNEVLIGADAADMALNLYYAIMAVPAQAGTKFDSDTVTNPYVLVPDKPTTGAITIESRDTGAITNLIAVADAATNFTWAGSATTLSGGRGRSNEALAVVRNVTDNAAAANTMFVLGPYNSEIALAATGWEGPPNKIHIINAATVGSAWATTDVVEVEAFMRPLVARV